MTSWYPSFNTYELRLTQIQECLTQIRLDQVYAFSVQDFRDCKLTQPELFWIERYYNEKSIELKHPESVA